MSRFNNGWIKVHRSLVDGHITQRGGLTLATFVRLLCWANRLEGSAFFAGEQINLLPGQVITGLQELSPNRDEDPYFHRVRSALDYLESSATIQQVVRNRGRLITICNWVEYQFNEDTASKQPASQAQDDRSPSAVQAQLIGEEKKERKNTARTGVRAEYSQEFEKAWEAYGKEGKKSDAFKAFQESSLTPDEAATLLQAIPPYLADCKAKDRRVMYFGTFLRDDWTPWLERKSSVPRFKTREQLIQEGLINA